MDKTMNDYVFDFAFSEALDDAIRRTDAAGLNDSQFIESAKEAVRKYINTIIESKKGTDLSDLFDKTVISINLSKKPKTIFSFGNIQKLINMTAKYMFISGYENKTLRKKFEICHCPMDSKMRNYVWKEYKLKFPNDKNLLKVPEGGREYIAWSKLRFDDTDDARSNEYYRNFQDMVKILAKEEGISPLEYDFKHWKEANAN